MLRGSGILVAISWGWPGMLFCVLTGVVLGLPVAAFSIAFLRRRLAQVSRGADANSTLGGPLVKFVLVMPWFLMAAAAYLATHSWLFPPVGGPLVALNVLWARTLVYRYHLRAYDQQNLYPQQSTEWLGRTA